MREHRKQRQQDKKLDTTSGRIVRHWIPAVYERNKLGVITYFYIYDGGSWFIRTYISSKEFAHRITILITSTAAFGLGIGIFIDHLFGGWK